MNHLGLIIFILLSYEILKYFKVTKLINENFDVYKNFINQFKKSETRERLNEKEIFLFSKKLLISSFKIFMVLIFIILLIFINSLIIENFSNFLISIKGIIETSIILFIYHNLRKKING
ncbi:MAG: hypothetical protein CBC25_01045 [Pelagibacteraceae bacterium TMED65]|nr:MAG: hypothetical protein CBC25_01045 [Pelagibacteraceae bacterium TMED65]|tara:strand:- start:868 stop:1224 length:357 start_codon:yes stop_codon:yes gene_type:complete